MESVIGGDREDSAAVEDFNTETQRHRELEGKTETPNQFESKSLCGYRFRLPSPRDGDSTTNGGIDGEETGSEDQDHHRGK